MQVSTRGSHLMVREKKDWSIGARGCLLSYASVVVVATKASVDCRFEFILRTKALADNSIRSPNVMVAKVTYFSIGEYDRQGFSQIKWIEVDE